MSGPIGDLVPGNRLLSGRDYPTRSARLVNCIESMGTIVDNRRHRVIWTDMDGRRPWNFGTRRPIRATRPGATDALALELARADERRKIAQDLHDEFGQQLTAIRLDLGWLRRRSPEDL